MLGVVPVQSNSIALLYKPGIHNTKEGTITVVFFCIADDLGALWFLPGSSPRMSEVHLQADGGLLVREPIFIISSLIEFL